MALKQVRDRREMMAAKRWASERAEFANVHFRHLERGRYQDAAYIAEDFLGTAEPNRKQRTAQMLASQRAADAENLRLARDKHKKMQGGGSTRVEGGKVIVMGQPDIFRRLAEKHEAEMAAKGKR
jgi:hypothetical protein